VSPNSDKTWATLKRAVIAPSFEDAAATKSCMRRGGPQRVQGCSRLPANFSLERTPFCAPALHAAVAADRRPQCTASSPLCAVVASATAPLQFTVRLFEALPPSMPVLLAHWRPARGMYPARRHAAVSHLTFIVRRYGDLPRAVALLTDYGDAHGSSSVDSCAQTFHLQQLSGLGAAQLGHGAALDETVRSLGPSSGNASSASGRFRCEARRLSAAEASLWRSRLAPLLGPPPEDPLRFYAGGQLSVPAKRLRSRPLEVSAFLISARVPS
jgi:hypothetical protein